MRLFFSALYGCIEAYAAGSIERDVRVLKLLFYKLKIKRQFNPEPAATADFTPYITAQLQPSPRQYVFTACLSAVAAGSGLNEVTVITEGVFQLAHFKTGALGSLRRWMPKNLGRIMRKRLGQAIIS